MNIKRTDFGGYGDVARAFDYGEQYHSPWVLDLLHSKIGGMYRTAKVLDVGCGTGKFTRALKRRGFDVSGVDPDERMIDVAEKRNTQAVIQRRQNIAYYCDRQMSLQFLSSFSFDAITAHYSFEHFGNERRIMGRLRMLLRPAGVFMTVTWPIGDLGRKRAEIIRPFVTDPREPPPLDHLTEIGYADVLREWYTDVETHRRAVTLQYSVLQARRYMRAAGMLSSVPRIDLPDVYRLLDEFCAREADASGHLYRTIDVIVDIARRRS